MNAYEKIEQLKDDDFKLITGVTRKVFNIMRETLQKRYEEEHARGGRPGLAVELRLTLALEYWREYRTFRHMANDHQINKNKIHNAVVWVENVLSETERFKLKDLQERFRTDKTVAAEVFLIDVEEQPVERPKYDQERSYLGKKNGTRQNIR